MQADWWSENRKEPNVRKAIQKGFALHFGLAVAARFEVAKAQDNLDYCPTSWARFARDLHSERSDIFRKRKGKVALTMGDILSTAAILDMSPRDLIPESYEECLTQIAEELIGKSGECPDSSKVNLFVRICKRLIRRWKPIGERSSRNGALRIDEEIVRSVARKELNESELRELSRELAELAERLHKGIKEKRWRSTLMK